MFGIVIDKNGLKIDFFVLDNEGNPQGYELQSGEQVITIDWNIANAMNKPQWNGSKWIDTDPLPPVIPEPPQPDKTEVLLARVNQLEKEKHEQQDTIDFLMRLNGFEPQPVL